MQGHGPATDAQIEVVSLQGADARPAECGGGAALGHRVDVQGAGASPAAPQERLGNFNTTPLHSGGH